MFLLQDQYGEHPEERAAKNVEVVEKLGEVQTLTHIFTHLKEKVIFNKPGAGRNIWQNWSCYNWTQNLGRKIELQKLGVTNSANLVWMLTAGGLTRERKKRER